MRRYLTDPMIEHPVTFKLRILPYFIAERLNARDLKIDTSNKYPHEFSVEMRTLLAQLGVKERKALLKNPVFIESRQSDQDVRVYDGVSASGRMTNGVSVDIITKPYKVE